MPLPMGVGAAVPGGVGASPMGEPQAVNMRAIPVAPGTTAAGPRYSMGSTGSVIDNGSGISPAGPYTMPGGTPGHDQATEATQARNNLMGQASGSATQLANPFGFGASNPLFYGR